VENLLEMNDLLKTEYCNIPLTIPKPWREFFQKRASTLGISRNAAFCMALKFGGPMLDEMISQARRSIHAACGNSAPLKTSEILGTPTVSEIALEPSNENERTEPTTQSRGRCKPGRQRK
jgi:hypothetical protein